MHQCAFGNPIVHEVDDVAYKGSSILMIVALTLIYHINVCLHLFWFILETMDKVCYFAFLLNIEQKYDRQEKILSTFLEISTELVLGL